MKKPLPLTGFSSVTVNDPIRQRFLSSLQAAISKTASSGKAVIRPSGERKPEPELAPIPAPVAKAPDPRRAPPPRPTFKRPSGLTK